MEFLKLVRQRRSVRKFQSRPIPEESLRTIYEVINSAPSAGNVQAYEVFVVEDKERLRPTKPVAQAVLITIFRTLKHRGYDPIQTIPSF